jgi:hypothetical protein
MKGFKFYSGRKTHVPKGNDGRREEGRDQGMNGREGQRMREGMGKKGRCEKREGRTKMDLLRIQTQLQDRTMAAFTFYRVTDKRDKIRTMY